MCVVVREVVMMMCDLVHQLMCMQEMVLCQ